MPNRPIFLLLICLAAAAAGFGYMKTLPEQGRGSGRLAGAPGKTEAPAADYTSEDFRRDFASAVDAARSKAGQAELAADPRLDAWLQTNQRAIACDHLERFSSVQIPGFKSIRLSAVSGGDLQELSGTLCGMICAPDAEMDNRMAFHVRPVAGTPGHEVLVLTGEALQELTIAALNEGATDTFLSKCPHCRQQVALKYEKSGCGFAVDCPSCRRRCRVIAQDTSGRYHDATTFLLPSRCPEVDADAAPLDVMLTLWRSVVSGCRYVEDSRSGAPADLWQTPGQTQRRGAGDCEDSALLLTDWLLTRGISARFVMGTMEGGGHAWCVARVDGTDYLLESTDRHPDMETLPVVNPGNGYEPTSQIDRDALYVRAKPGLPFDGDYWSAEKWIRLPRPKPAAAKTASGKPAAARAAAER